MDLQENGNVGVRKYSRVVDSEEDNDSSLSNSSSQKNLNHHKNCSSTTTTYVMACAIFASLNSVLLGYGSSISISLLFISPLLFSPRSLSLSHLYYLHSSDLVLHSCRLLLCFLQVHPNLEM